MNLQGVRKVTYINTECGLTLTVQTPSQLLIKSVVHYFTFTSQNYRFKSVVV